MLDGIKVLDFSRVLAGPFVTMILGDLGADIIKVEPPGGDETRQWAPFVDGESAYFMSTNRNKKSIVIDLRRDEGKEIVYKLVKTCDIVVENFRPGVVEKLGIDYNTLRKHKEDIIYCSVKGFGTKGPYVHKPAYDIILQAMSGLMATTGEEGRPPVRVSFALVDIFAGLFAVNSILAALYEREKTGKGKHIEVSLYDSIVFAMSYIPMIYLLSGQMPRRLGSGHPSIVPYQAFECADGKYIIVAAANDRFWQRLCDILGREDLKNDERFKTNPDRVRNRNILIPILEEIFRTRPRDEWTKLLEKAGVPYGPVYSLDEVFRDPYIVSSGIVGTIKHEKLGEIKQLLYPALFNGQRLPPKSPPPIMGRHAIEILKELGYSADEIQRLIKENIICCSD